MLDVKELDSIGVMGQRRIHERRFGVGIGVHERRGIGIETGGELVLAEPQRALVDPDLVAVLKANDIVRSHTGEHGHRGARENAICGARGACSGLGDVDDVGGRGVDDGRRLVGGQRVERDENDVLVGHAPRQHVPLTGNTRGTCDTGEFWITAREKP